MLLTVGIGFLYQRKKAAASSVQLFALVRLRPTAIFNPINADTDKYRPTK